MTNLNPLNIKIILTVSVILIAFMIQIILKKYISHRMKKIVPKNAKMPLAKGLNIGIFFIVIIAIISIWGVNVDNLWIYLTGVLGLIAIGFFAVWSILSNIITGLILISLRRFNPGDHITILPEKVSGEIIDITFMFIVLKDKNTITFIPNNLIFQRFTKIRLKETTEKKRVKKKSKTIKKK